VAGCFLQATVTLGMEYCGLLLNDLRSPSRTGNPLAWGVFQQYYKDHVFPEATEAKTCSPSRVIDHSHESARPFLAYLARQLVVYVSMGSLLSVE
jgi:hypothetical protein